MFKRWRHKYLRRKTFIPSCWHGKKKCDSEVRVEIVCPSPLDAVRFKEVGDFLFQYGILGVRDDALMREDSEEWAIDC